MEPFVQTFRRIGLFFVWVHLAALIIAPTVLAARPLHPDYAFGAQNRTRQGRTFFNKRGFDPTAEVYDGEYVGRHPQGGVQVLKYNITVSPDVHLLNDYPVDSVECGRSHFTVKYSPDAIQLDLDAIEEHWHKGAILVGGAEWNCSVSASPSSFERVAAEGEPFYAVVQEIVNFTPTAAVFVVKYTNATDCFSVANISFTWAPEHHRATTTTSETSLQQREVDTNPLTWEVFNYNWDNANKVPKTPKILLNEYAACIDCYAYMDVAFYFNYQTSWTSDVVSLLEMGLTGSAQASFNYELNFKSTGEEKTLVVDRVPVTEESSEFSYTFVIAYIPVVLSIKSQLKATVESVGSVEFSASTGAKAGGQAQFGVKYAKSAVDVKGEWEQISELDWHWDFNSPTWMIQTEGANINAYLVPYVTFTLWNLFPLVIRPQPYIGVRLDKPAGKSFFDKRSVTVISPPEGGTWTIGEAATIEWTTSNIPATAVVEIYVGYKTISWNPAAFGPSNVGIALYSPGFISGILSFVGQGYYDITPEGGIPNTGSWQYDPSLRDYKSDDGYQLLVYSVSNTKVHSYSDTFAMGIRVVTPSAPLTRGLAYTIQWTGASSSNYVSIAVVSGWLLRTVTDIQVVPDTGLWIWPAVDLAPDSYFFRIIDQSNTKMLGESEWFHVSGAAGSITVLSPNSGTFYVLQTMTVTWSVTGVIGDYVKLDLVWDRPFAYDTVVPLTSSVLAAACTWTGPVPAITTEGDGWEVRITSVGGSNVIGEGQDGLKIHYPSLSVTLPTASTKILAGGIILLQWTSSFFHPSATIKIRLDKYGYFSYSERSTYVGIPVSAGSHTIAAPTEFSTWRVVLTSEDIPSLYAASDDFETVATALSDVTPGSGTFYTGGLVTIRWTSVGDVGSTVSIYLRHLLGTWYKLTQTASNTGGSGNSWSVLIPWANPGYTNNYWYFEIVSNADPGVKAASAGYITLIQPTLRLTGPTSSSSFTAGNQMSVYWSSVGFLPSATLTLTLWHDDWGFDTQKALITLSVPATSQYYSWTIPASITSGSYYYVRAEVNGDTSNTAESASFSISAASTSWFGRRSEVANINEKSEADPLVLSGRADLREALFGEDVTEWREQLSGANITTSGTTQAGRGTAANIQPFPKDISDTERRITSTSRQLLSRSLASTVKLGSAKGMTLPSCLGTDDVPFHLYYGVGIGFAIGDVVLNLPIIGQTQAIAGWDLGDLDVIEPTDIECSFCGGCIRIPKAFSLGGSSNVPNSARSWAGTLSAISRLGRRATCGLDPCDQTCSSGYTIQLTGQDAVEMTTTDPGSCNCPSYIGYTDDTTLAVADSASNFLMAKKGSNDVSVDHIKSSGEICSQSFSFVGRYSGGSGADGVGTGAGGAGAGADGAERVKSGGGIPIAAIAGGAGGK
ncbi:hypothetical protein HDU85_005937 [Gaertneriomyces sp. JEL0708]|nr:hypothetical protein HDU85_005937 [Gaertneriomyces sp. JEL0708]